MVEINLLPWRQHVYVSQQKRIRDCFLGGSFFFMIVFIFIHMFLGMEIKEANVHLIQLENQLSEMHEHSSQKMPFNSSQVEKFYFSQKKLNGVLEKIAHADLCHIQISTINFMEKSILWAGNVGSVYAVACWIKAFRHISIQNFRVEKIKDSDLQKFSFLAWVK